MASPTYKAPDRAAGPFECISDMRMGSPCSLPPVIEMPSPSFLSFLFTLTARIRFMSWDLRSSSSSLLPVGSRLGVELNGAEWPMFTLLAIEMASAWPDEVGTSEEAPANASPVLVSMFSFAFCCFVDLFALHAFITVLCRCKWISASNWFYSSHENNL